MCTVNGKQPEMKLTAIAIPGLLLGNNKLQIMYLQM